MNILIAQQVENKTSNQQRNYLIYEIVDILV